MRKIIRSTSRLKLTFFVGFTAGFPFWGHCHLEPVHEKLCERAAESSASFKDFLTMNFPSGAPLLPLVIPLPFPSFGTQLRNETPIDWLKMGGSDEDGGFGGVPADPAIGAIRGRRHFYNPLNGEGLSDFGFFAAVNPSQSSYSRAIEQASIIPLGGNLHSWYDARYHQDSALTDQDPTVRKENFARLFYTLGHVLHLNQDLAQPQHVRNDTHGLQLEIIEGYGQDVYMKTAADLTAWNTMFPLSSKLGLIGKGLASLN